MKLTRDEITSLSNVLFEFSTAFPNAARAFQAAAQLARAVATRVEAEEMAGASGPTPSTPALAEHVEAVRHSPAA
jgi:hypothetical protein